jgi:hypothetical protein
MLCASAASARSSTGLPPRSNTPANEFVKIGDGVKNTARNRIVVFRLSQDEYRNLKKACNSHGARNLSDFTRSEVLAFLHASLVSKRIQDRSASLEERIAGLQSAVNDLLLLLKRQLFPAPGELSPENPAVALTGPTLMASGIDAPRDSE